MKRVAFFSAPALALALSLFVASANAQPLPPPPLPPTPAGAPKPTPGTATSDADDAKTGPTEDVPWYFPAASERFVPPAKPKPKPHVPSALSLSTDFHFFGAPISGSATEIRVHGGIPWISGHVGALMHAGPTLYVIGLNVGRWTGITIAGQGTGHELKLLFPNFDLRALSDIKESVIVAVGTGITGLRYCASCGAGGTKASFPLKVELRGPTITRWIPIAVNDSDNGLASVTSYGFALDMGVYF